MKFAVICGFCGNLSHAFIVPPVAFTSYLEDVEVKLEKKHELLLPIIALSKKNCERMRNVTHQLKNDFLIDMESKLSVVVVKACFLR